MENKLFVASLSFKIRDAELHEIFASVGNVLSAKVILDRAGRSKGFGFVEMATPEEADQAIAKLHNSEHFGRPIVVNKQKPQEPRSNSFDRDR
jgi:RNA recognition motif-containing protein